MSTIERLSQAHKLYILDEFSPLLDKRFARFVGIEGSKAVSDVLKFTQNRVDLSAMQSMLEGYRAVSISRRRCLTKARTSCAGHRNEGKDQFSLCLGLIAILERSTSNETTLKGQYMLVYDTINAHCRPARWTNAASQQEVSLSHHFGPTEL